MAVFTIRPDERMAYLVWLPLVVSYWHWLIMLVWNDDLVSISWCRWLLSNPTASFCYKSIAPTSLKESHQMPRCARHPLLLSLLRHLSSWAASFFTPLFTVTGLCFKAASSSSGPHHKRNEKSLGISHPAHRHIGTNPTYMYILHRNYVYGFKFICSLFFLARYFVESHFVFVGVMGDGSDNSKQGQRNLIKWIHNTCDETTTSLTKNE
jgi:hypothetical protein